MTGWLEEQLGRRPFEAFQIEVTSRCILQCVMCPRTAIGKGWPSLDLSWEAFERIAAAFALTKFVHLQGWGEPLLHPRLFDMISRAKNAGCRVGFTTNGVLLELEISRRLLDCDLDLLALSLAGATRRTHESIRAKSDFAAILNNAGRLLTLRAKRASNKPKVEMFYLMTKTNLAELPRAVELAADLGADELVATNLDYVITPEHEELAAFTLPSRRAAFDSIVSEARDRARRAGLGFRAYPLEAEEKAVCEADPLRILFLSCDGWVSPCNYMGLPGRADVPRRFEGRALRVPRLRFGHILERELTEVWDGPAYRDFRRQFEARRRGSILRALGAVARGPSSFFPGAPAPEPCRTCYKLYGL